MKLNTISPAEGEKTSRKRVGRGIGSGFGKTAGRGHKGQKSRSGGFHKIGFEGGQMPLQRRVPKFGFKNPNRVEFRAINLDVLQLLAEEKKLKEINLETLMQNGLAGRHDLVKVLGRGTLTAALKVSAHKFSASATAAIEAAGGSVETL